MYVRAGRPAFARPCVGLHKSTSLMSSSLLLQQCPACLVRLTWIVFVIGGRWPYSWCLVGCCRQDLLCINVYMYVYICISAKETKVDRNWGIETRSKPISSGATSIRETWRDMPWTDKNGEARFTELLPTSKRLYAKNSLLPERNHREASAEITTTDFQGPHCSRLCASGLGLRSHLRVQGVVECKRYHRIRWTTTICIYV